MVIVPNRVGQLGNQLFHIAHFSAAAIEYGFRFVYASFEYPVENFPEINSDPRVMVRNASARRNVMQARAAKILRLGLPSSPFHRCHHSDGLPHFDLGSEDFVAESGRKLVICEGFGFRTPELVRHHRDRLVRMLSFSSTIRSEVDLFQRSLRLGADGVLVGFHVRRADYRQYQGGKYYIEDDGWARAIEALHSEISSSGRKMVGICFSNEDCSDLLKRFEGILIRGPGGLYTDCEMLSRCDHIVAPPSTYSGWASFLKGTPVIHLARGCDEVSLGLGRMVDW